MKRINIFILRHGQTKGTEWHRYYGRTDMPLSKQGKWQIKKLRINGMNLGASRGELNPRLRVRRSQRRKHFGKGGLKADYVYSSPLKRCQETAMIIGRPIEISNDLIEIDFGEWEGLTMKEMQKRNPRKFNNWMYDFTNFRMPGGESVKSMVKRVNRFWKYVINKHRRGNILIVTHGGPAKIIIMKLFGIPMEKFWSLHIGTGELWVKSY